MSFPSTTGRKGVQRKGDRYQVQIQFAKRNIYIGQYDTLEEAIIAVTAAERALEKIEPRVPRNWGESWRTQQAR